MDDDLAVAQDYTDASADRGLTTDDVAEVALEEAGISHTPRPRIGDSRPAPKPQIGDSRPAAPGDGAGGNGAAATDAATGEPVAPKRRRRRGGRGRGAWRRRWQRRHHPGGHLARWGRWWARHAPSNPGVTTSCGPTSA